MPVFPESSVYYKGRTNTQLVVSEGNAPAEKYLAAEATNAVVKFQYEFGPEGNNSVVIPKGKIVSFAGVEYDVDTEKHIPRVKIAVDAATEAVAAGGPVPMGVNHHNVYQRRRDRFSGSEPTILTREYIRIPLFIGDDDAAAATAAKAIQFGAMSVGVADSANKTAQEKAELIYGKYVTSDANGNFRLWNATTDHTDKILGQVYGVETDIPPAGFLQYFLEFNDAQFDEFIKATQIVPSPGRTKDKANTLDIQTFPVGTGYFKTTQDLAIALKSFRSGIPFLTDGYFKARTSKTYATLADASVIDIRTMGGVSIEADKKIKVSDHVGAALFIRIKEKFCQDLLPKYDVTRDLVPDSDNFPEYGSLAPAGIVVKVGGTEVSPANYHIDFENNMVVIYFTAEVAVAADVSITATVLENQIPGIPTGWDFKNNIGEARILLMK